MFVYSFQLIHVFIYQFIRLLLCFLLLVAPKTESDPFFLIYLFNLLLHILLQRDDLQVKSLKGFTSPQGSASTLHLDCGKLLPKQNFECILSPPKHIL